MAIFPQLVGVLLAAMLLAALIFSVVRIFLTSGFLQTGHVAAAILILLGAFAVTVSRDNLAVFLGSALAFSSALTVLLEKGWNRLLPLVSLLFAVALLMGLPFPGM